MAWNIKIPSHKISNREIVPPAKVELPELLKGDTITWIPEGRRGLKLTGVIVDKTEKMLVVNLGRYRDTILINDLVNGHTKIISVEKGDGIMGKTNKIEKPEKEYLQTLFNNMGGNISKTAKACKLTVSDNTMAKWLREHGIITPIPDAPPDDQLRLAWEEVNRKISGITRIYGINSVTANKWLKEAGIITKGPVGKTTATLDPVPNPEDKTETTGNDGFGPGDEAPIPYKINHQEDSVDPSREEELWQRIFMLTTKQRIAAERLMALEKTVADITAGDDGADHSTVKKLVDFCVAPIHGRIDKLEQSIAALAKIILAKDAADREADQIDRLDIAAELFVRVLDRV